MNIRHDSLGSDSVGAKNGGAETSVANTMAPYELGTDYHIAVTFQRSGEATVVRWQRRDAATGELQKSGTLTMPAGIHGFVIPSWQESALPGDPVATSVARVAAVPKNHSRVSTISPSLTRAHPSCHGSLRPPSS